ncbi:diguanylate cyclase [Roseiflexus sp.]|uniref:diguanylate cyclase n=1 Tax=Roseiflexus sp. TaxID=2562120 RepID=UPI00398A8AB0
MNEADDLQAENDALKARIRELEQRLMEARATHSSLAIASDDNASAAAFHQTMLAIMNRLDLNDVLEAIVEHAARLAGTTHGFLHLRRFDAEVMEMAVTVGRFLPNRGCTITPGEGVSGRVWQTGEPMMVEDYRSWEGRIERLEDTDFGAIIAVPLKLKGTIIGVLGIAYDAAEQNDVQSTFVLLARFADLAAIAIDNAQLYTSAQEELSEQRRIETELRISTQHLRDMYRVAQRQSQELHLLGEVRAALAREIDLPAIFRTVVESIASTFGYTQVCLYLRKNDELILQHQVGYPFIWERIPVGKGIISRTILSECPTLVADVTTDRDFLGVIDGVVSEICVPLRDQGTVIGALNIESRNGVVLTEDDLRLMTEMAEHINVAIERARLYERLWRHAQQLDALYSITGDITGNLHLDDVLKTIVERMLALIRAEHGALALYDAQCNDLLVHLSVNMNHDYASVRLALGEGAMGKAALNRRPVIVYDYRSWNDRSLQCEDEATANVLAVPLLAGDELIGAMSAGVSDLTRVFTDDDVRLLNMFAQQATIAIKNARLFAEVQHMAITDPLMGIYNRRYFHVAGRREFERAQRHRRPLAVIIVDLDDFKRINDVYGHPIGDRVLQTVSHTFRRVLRSEDLLARYGGEEIIILLPDTDHKGAVRVVERLRLMLEQTSVATNQGPVRVTASAGVAVLTDPYDIADVETLIEQADQALLRAKQAGKNRVEIWREGSRIIHDSSP